MSYISQALTDIENAIATNEAAITANDTAITANETAVTDLDAKVDAGRTAGGIGAFSILESAANLGTGFTLGADYSGLKYAGFKGSVAQIATTAPGTWRCMSGCPTGGGSKIGAIFMRVL